MKGKIFNAQEVQSIISGNKTQFREVIKPQPPLGCYYTINGNQSHALCFADCSTPRDERDYSKEPLVCVPPKPTSVDHRLECPYQVGQKIFCKESFAYHEDESGFGSGYMEYKADNIPNGIARTLWSPAQHMKQEHSRLTPQIKEIRVERLADISEEDCLKEGCGVDWCEARIPDYYECDDFTAKDNFIALWNLTHKKPEEKFFEASPFVWCVNFEVINN